VLRRVFLGRRTGQGGNSGYLVLKGGWVSLRHTSTAGGGKGATSAFSRRGKEWLKAQMLGTSTVAYGNGSD